MVPAKTEFLTVADLRFDKGVFKSKLCMRERLTVPEFQGAPPTF